MVSIIKKNNKKSLIGDSNNHGVKRIEALLSEGFIHNGWTPEGVSGALVVVPRAALLVCPLEVFLGNIQVALKHPA